MSVKTIDLETAANRISWASKEPDGRRPYFFIVGAGISKPPVPLASEIEEHCKEVIVQQHMTADEPEGLQSIDSYSFWFEQAYPQPSQQQKYMRGLIKGKTISPANFRLAHLLLEKKIANVVVTTNFDDFISRALDLFVEPHIICDHPATVGRINPENTKDVQILHVHGTYWFYDLRNLRPQIEKAQENKRLRSKLEQILLGESSPLVIGYSGWEQDAIMTALKNRLSPEQDPLPYNLYWFCYQRNVIDSLPSWLKEHDQVYFVVPQQKTDLKSAPDSTAQKENPGQRTELQTTKPSDEDHDKGTLSAQQVLDKLIARSNANAPGLLKDPLGFLADHLKRSLLQEGCQEVDIYYVQSVVRRIERAKEKYDETLGQVEAQLEDVLDALRRSQYREAIIQGTAIEVSDLTPGQMKELMDSIWSASTGLADNSKEELEGYALVVSLGDALSMQVGDEIGVREMIGKALLIRGNGLSILNRQEEAIVIYDELLKRFDDATEPVLRELVASALINKASGIANSKKYEEAIAIYDETLKRFSEATEPILQHLWAMAMFNKGLSLFGLGRKEQALAIFDDLVRLFGSSKEPGIQEQVATALGNKAYILNDLNRAQEALAVCDEVVDRWGESKEPAVRTQLARSLNDAGFLILKEAKRLWASGDERLAQLTLLKAQEKIRAALAINPENPLHMGNQGYIAFLLGDKKNAQELLTRAISAGGESIRLVELDNSEIHALPQDEEFRELVRSIPAPDQETKQQVNHPTS